VLKAKTLPLDQTYFTTSEFIWIKQKWSGKNRWHIKSFCNEL